MLSPRARALMSEADALQQARARLYQRLDELTDLCDVISFVDTLADVAMLHAKTNRSKPRREQWGRLADALHQLHQELSASGRTPKSKAPVGRPGRSRRTRPGGETPFRK
jgi:hypothetical protein